MWFSFSVMAENGDPFAYLEFDGWINIDLQHALNINDRDNFVYRANISIPSLNSGLSNIAQTVLKTNDLENLKRLSVSDGFYRLKAVVEYPNGLKRTFYTANKACSLLSSKLNDEIWISIDSNGYVNSISLSTSEGDYEDCSTMDFSNLSTKEFNTEILIRHAELAPVPDTASFIQKIEREREARERGESKDNRGFFAKYGQPPNTTPTTELNACGICHKSDDKSIISCSTCRSAFHLLCVNVDNNQPQETWLCQNCNNFKQQRKPPTSTRSVCSNVSTASRSRKHILELQRLHEETKLEREFIRKKYEILEQANEGESDTNSEITSVREWLNNADADAAEQHVITEEPATSTTPRQNGHTFSSDTAFYTCPPNTLVTTLSTYPYTHWMYIIPVVLLVFISGATNPEQQK